MLAVSDLAKNWSRSGEDPGRLYPGSNDQIIALLKIWHAARRTNLSEIITLYRNMLNLHNILYGLGEDLGVDLQAQHQIWDPKLDQMEGHANDLALERDSENLIGHFLIQSLKTFAIAWPISDWKVANETLDIDVCSVLSIVDPTFDAPAERKIPEEYWETLRAIAQSQTHLTQEQNGGGDHGDEQAIEPAKVARYFQNIKIYSNKPSSQTLATVAGKVISVSDKQNPPLVAESLSKGDTIGSGAGAEAKVEGKLKTKRRNETRKRAKAAAKAATKVAAEATASAVVPDADLAAPEL